MSECLHRPEPKPGRKCDCFDCRTARMRVFDPIAKQCIRCAGRCATDAHGDVTCEKSEYDCPVLDLWFSIVNREIDPAKVGPVQVELAYNRRKDPPVVYRRVPVSATPRYDGVPDPRVTEEPARRRVRRARKAGKRG